MTPRARQRPSGFSLIELVAAMAIFSMGVMACLELYSISLRSASDSVGYTQAVFLAQAEMEETVAEGSLVEGTDSGDFGNNYPNHTWESEIRDTDETGLKEVQVDVHWMARGKEKTYTLVTRRADRDVSEALP